MHCYTCTTSRIKLYVRRDQRALHAFENIAFRRDRGPTRRDGHAAQLTRLVAISDRRWTRERGALLPARLPAASGAPVLRRDVTPARRRSNNARLLLANAAIRQFRIRDIPDHKCIAPIHGKLRKSVITAHIVKNRIR